MTMLYPIVLETEDSEETGAQAAINEAAEPDGHPDLQASQPGSASGRGVMEEEEIEEEESDLPSFEEQLDLDDPGRLVDLPQADSLFQVVGLPPGSGLRAPPDNVVPTRER